MNVFDVGRGYSLEWKKDMEGGREGSEWVAEAEGREHETERWV